MNDCFNDGARSVMALANKIAGRRGDDFVGVEHILLAILSPEGAKIRENQRVVELFGFGQKALFQQFDEKIPLGNGPAMEVFGKLPLTIRAKKALNLSIQESRYHIGTTFVGPEHLLLGLIHDDEGVAAIFLKEIGLTLELAREVIHKNISKPEFS
jgi:ATP-dependent Clp protease ATP-binding subunit ClpC